MGHPLVATGGYSRDPGPQKGGGRTPQSCPTHLAFITFFRHHNSLFLSRAPHPRQGHTTSWAGWLPTWGFPGDVGGAGQQAGWT